MKWNEGFRRVWLVWCGLVAVLFLGLLSIVVADNINTVGETISGVLILFMMAAAAAYLPRLPWLAADLWNWVVDGFKQPPKQ
jgi:hypothetical protein